MADRVKFLEKIRTAAAQGRQYPFAVNPQATAKESYVGGGADPIQSLLDQWQTAGGKPARVQGDAAARRFVGEFLMQHRAARTICWDHPLLKRLQLDSVAVSAGSTLEDWTELAQLPAEIQRARMLDANVGITSANWAIAETGSLVLCSSPTQGRLASLLPRACLAIIEPSQILPDLFDLFAALEPGKMRMPSNLVFVTGPSKTGDIEMKLTTGVHGPGDVTLLVVEPDAPTHSG